MRRPFPAVDRRSGAWWRRCAKPSSKRLRNRRGRRRAGPRAATGPLRTRRPEATRRKGAHKPYCGSRGCRKNSGTRGGFVISGPRTASEARQRRRPGSKKSSTLAEEYGAERGGDRGQPRPHQKVVHLNPISAIVLLVIVYDALCYCSLPSGPCT